ncbi:MAG: (2Fe-2S)-binding protein [Planctomycetes bacterium]|nr:(2Fe-2S)-binding protein [Planctomycetota bacterium]
MPKITFSTTGQTYEVAEGTAFLDFCQEHDAPHAFGCTVGSCGTCVCVVEAAAGSVNAASTDELDTLEMCTDAAGARLGCQLKVHGDVTIKPAD